MTHSCHNAMPVINNKIIFLHLLYADIPALRNNTGIVCFMYVCCTYVIQLRAVVVHLLQ